MKIFTKNNLPLVSKRYLIDFSNFSLQEVKVPEYNEYIGTIYMFVNNINGKLYIGQTMTKFYSRFTNHYGDSFTKKDHYAFHASIRKYGWDNFSKYILWQDDIIYEATKENKQILRDILDIKEKEYISLYNSNNLEFGYNLTEGGSEMPKNIYSKESIDKAKLTSLINHSNGMLGKTYDKHHLAKHILQYDLNKQFVKEWPCIKLAEDTLHISISPKNITCGNFFWIYVDDEIEKKLEIKYNLYLKQLTKKSYPGIPKPIYCFDLFGEFVGSYKSASEASIIFDISSTSINHAAAAMENGNVVGDYIWIYEEDLNNKENIINTLQQKSKIYKSRYKPIYLIYLNGDIIKLWDNFETIISEYPKAKASINKCLHNKLNVYCNCFWVYEEDYSDDLLREKLNNYRKTKKTLVDDIMNGVIKYEGLDVKHDTNNSKNYLKEHPCIYQFDLNYNLIKKWDNYLDTKNMYNFDNISKCLRRKLKTAFGYIWRYEEDVINNNLK